jgi:hypothetical protein
MAYDHVDMDWKDWVLVFVFVFSVLGIVAGGLTLGYYIKLWLIN